MLGLVKNVQPYIKPKPKVEVPRADNFVFRLHYRVRKQSFLTNAIEFEATQQKVYVSDLCLI